jgi:hypothetical protein
MELELIKQSKDVVVDDWEKFVSFWSELRAEESLYSEGMDAQVAGCCIIIIFSQILSKFYSSP